MIAALEPPSPASTAPVAPVLPEPRPRSTEELLASVSASRLTTWLGCRLKFYFRYVQGLSKPASPALQVGTVVHGVLQQWNLARWRRQPLPPEALHLVFHTEWQCAATEHPVAWENPEEEGNVKASAFNLLEAYLRDTPIPVTERPEGVEVMVERDLTCHGLPKLVGVLDLVRQGGRIVDFKTTARTPDPQQVLHTTEVQTTAYALLYREATGRVESGIELHHLVRLKTPKLVVTQAGPASAAQGTRLLRQIEAYVQGVERQDYLPAPGLQCAACEFFEECRRWH